MCLIGTRRELGQSLKGCHLALQKCRMVILDTKRFFMLGCVLDSFLGFLESGLALMDILVGSTAQHQLLSFMDAFSGYNQIRMHEDDQEKLRS